MYTLAMSCYVLIHHLEALRRGVFLVPVVHLGTSLTSLGASMQLDQKDLCSTPQHRHSTPPRFWSWRVLRWLLWLSSKLASSRRSTFSSSEPSQKYLYLSSPLSLSSSGSVGYSCLLRLPLSSSSVLLRCERTQLGWLKNSFPSYVPCHYSCNRWCWTSKVGFVIFLVDLCYCCCCWC